MGQVSPKLRRAVNGYIHWCPACQEIHRIGDSWKFDGNLTRPTFMPSVKVTGVQTVKVNGRWTGEWVRGPNGKALPMVCHYFLNNGELRYCPDCTHDLRGQNVPLPDLPDFLTDNDYDH